VVLDPVLHHVRSVALIADMAVDPVHQRRPAVAQFPGDLVTGHGNPVHYVLALRVRANDPVGGLEPCRTVRVPEYLGPDLAGAPVQEPGRGVQRFPHVLDDARAPGGGEEQVILIAFLPFLANPAAAQRVQYWENRSQPNTSIEYDSQRCDQYARAYAMRILRASGPFSAPRGPWGQLATGVHDIVSQLAFQRHYDQAFDPCMTRLGWSKVSEADMRNRERDAALQRRLLEERQRRQAAEAETAWRAYRTNPPRVRPVHYDAFEQADIWTTDAAHIPTRNNLIGLMASYGLSVPRKEAEPELAWISLLLWGEQRHFQSQPSLTFIQDGMDPVRVPSQNLQYRHEIVDGTSVERFWFLIGSTDLVSLAGTRLFRCRLGHIEFDLPESHMAAIRELASHVRGSPLGAPIR
jgi:hypothetical protein